MTAANTRSDHRGRIVAAPRELPLRDDLRDDERREHGDAESGELEAGRCRYVNGCCEIDAKTWIMRMSPGSGADCVSASEIERAPLAPLEAEESGARDHRRVVGREPRRRREDLAPASPSRSRIAATSVRLHATPPPSTIRGRPRNSRGARRLLDERLDERILKRARDAGTIALDVRRSLAPR